MICYSIQPLALLPHNKNSSNNNMLNNNGYSKIGVATIHPAEKEHQIDVDFVAPYMLKNKI